MKKLLLVIITLVSVLLIGACNSAPSDTPQDEQDTKLVCVYGLNGITVCEEVETEEEAQSFFQSVQAKTETFDKTKTAPDYMKDELGDYVSFETVCSLLKDKYFGANESDDKDACEMGDKAYIRLFVYDEVDSNDVLAKMILMLEELRNYEFYVLSSYETYIEVRYITQEPYTERQLHMSINITTMVNDFFEITPDGIIDGDYEMELTLYGTTVGLVEVQALYDQYVLDGTYDGYVLNYVK